MTPQELERALDDIVTRLRDKYQPEKIILFGSYADGTADEDSDVDLLIIKQTDKRFIDRWTEVRRILSDANRFFGLDTLVMSAEEVRDRLERGDSFIRQIVRDGRLIYES